MAERVNFMIHIFTIINKKTVGEGEKVWKGKRCGRSRCYGRKPDNR